MKILSSFTHPHVVPNLYEFHFYVLCPHLMLMVPIDFHSISFPTMELNGNEQLFDSSKFFKISCFVFNIRKKGIQVWNDMAILIFG